MHNVEINKIVVATYHADCNDGTTAVAILLKKYPKAVVFGLSHDVNDTEGKDLQPIINILDAQTTLYTLDNAIGIRKFIESGAQIITIDHHISVKTELDDLVKNHTNFKYIFDNSHSGAMLSWNYFYKNKIAPDIVKYVEDADLWNWQYGKTTKDVTHWIMLKQNMPIKIIPYLTNKKNTLSKIIKEGTIMAEFSQFEIDSFLQNAKPTFLNINNNTVPAYNIACSKLQSSYIGNKLAEQHNKTVALFSINGDAVRLSFRSYNDDAPTSADLATYLDGGGHTRASGARVSLDVFLKMMCKDEAPG